MPQYGCVAFLRDNALPRRLGSASGRREGVCLGAENVPSLCGHADLRGQRLSDFPVPILRRERGSAGGHEAIGWCVETETPRAKGARTMSALTPERLDQMA